MSTRVVFGHTSWDFNFALIGSLLTPESLGEECVLRNRSMMAPPTLSAGADLSLKEKCCWGLPFLENVVTGQLYKRIVVCVSALTRMSVCACECMRVDPCVHV